MFERFKIGFLAARDCWDVLRKDKKLILLPLMSSIACLAVLASFALPLVTVRPDLVQMLMDEDDHAALLLGSPIWFWLLLFVFYFCNYFVIYFFNAALIHCTLFQFRGMTISLKDGLHAAFRHLPQLIAWALVSATVGLVLRMIENSSDRLGRWVSALIGATWTIASYFVVPVLVVERVGPFKALKRSSEVLIDTWGEALGGQVGIGWFLLPFWFIGGCLIWLGMSLNGSVHLLGLFLIGAGIVYFIVLGLVNSVMDTILLSALYLYATQGEVPREMDRSMLENAFQSE